jgi:hypothetical protein
MSPVYNHDPTQVTAALAILPKDDYLFVIGRPKSFERTARAGHQSYGIRFPLTVVDGPQKGKKALYSIYLHSDGGAQMAKRFQLAVQGMVVNEKDEEAFNIWAAGSDWSYNPEDGTVGAAWAKYEGTHIQAALDVEMIKNEKDEDVESQIWAGFAPYKP